MAVVSATYWVQKVRRNLYWGRTHGWRDLVEEHDWNPMVTVPRWTRKRAWALRYGTPGQAVPVFLVGAQRSGTNMVVHGLAQAPEFDVYNEGDRAAFSRFQLRPDAQIRRLVDASPHRYVLLKPLCDTHRARELLDDMGTARPGRLIWVYRGVDARTRSQLTKFGDSDRRVLREFAVTGSTGRWQVQGLPADSIELIRSLDFDTLSPESGSALFWYVRNQLFFQLHLSDRPDVRLTSYEAFLQDPSTTMRALCDFLGFPYSGRLVAHVMPRPTPHRRPLDIDPTIRERCAQLQARLDAAATPR